MQSLIALCFFAAQCRCSGGKALQVLGAGLPRTGTQSLALALKQLGYRVLHSEGVNLKEPGLDIGGSALLTSIIHASNQLLGGQAQFEVFAPTLQMISELGVNATVDVPWSLIVDQLLKRNPDAKVILTMRDNADQWYTSYYREHRILSMAPEMLFPGLRYKKGTNRIIGCGHVEDWPPLPPTSGGRDSCISGYHDHNQGIRTLVPFQSLLVFNVKDGWGPLCDFLGHEVPNIPFPRNDFSALSFGTWAKSMLLAPTIVSTLAMYLVYFCLCSCCCSISRRRRRKADHAKKTA